MYCLNGVLKTKVTAEPPLALTAVCKTVATGKVYFQLQ